MYICNVIIIENMEIKKQIDIIKEECQKNGLDIRAVFRRADVPEATIQNWIRKEPEAFVTREKIHKTIETMKEEKLQEIAGSVEAEAFYPELIDGLTTFQTVAPTQRRRS